MDESDASARSARSIATVAAPVVRAGALLRFVGCVVGLSLAGLIAWRYALVDDGALLTYLHGTRSRALRYGMWFALAAALVGGSAGFAYGKRLRARSGWILAGVLLGLGSAGWWWPRVGVAFELIHVQSDGLRAAVVLGWAMVAAAGAHGGMTLSRCAPQGWFYNGVTVLVVIAMLLVTQAWLQVGGLLWAAVLCTALGRWSLERLGAAGSPATRATAPGLALATGMALMILLVLALGTTLGCAAEVILAFLALSTALLHRQVWSVLRAVPTLLYRVDATLSLSGALGHAALVALFSFYAVAALAPELGPDAIGMRIAAPQHWLRSGVLSGLPEMSGTFGAIAGEMLYLVALPLLGTASAKLIQTGVLLAMVLSLRRQIETGRGEPSGSSAPWVFLFASSSIVWVQVAWGFVDLLQAWFILTTVIGLQAWVADRGRWGLLAAAAFCAGTAAAIKLNGGIAVVIAGVVVAGTLLRGGRRWRDLGIGALVVGAGCSVAMLPWMFRSALLTGNPVFPFANGLFQSPLAPTELLAARFPGDSLWRVPWSLFFAPHRFVELGTYHPALLVLAPLALIGVVLWRPRLGGWGVAALLSVAFWALTEQNARYSLFAAGFCTVVLARGMVAWQAGLGPRGQATAAVLVAALTVAGFGAQVCRPGAWLWAANAGPALPTRVAFGAVTEDDYLVVYRPTFPAAQWLNQHHGGGARLWQVRGIRDHLYFEAPAIAMPHGVRPLIEPLEVILTDPATAHAPDRIHRILTDAGVTHLLYSTAGPPLGDLPDSVREGLFGREFTARYLTLCQAHSGMRLYAVCPRARAAAAWRPAPGLLANPRFVAAPATAPATAAAAAAAAAAGRGAAGDAADGVPGWDTIRGVPCPIDGGGVSLGSRDDEAQVAQVAEVAQAAAVEAGATYQLEVGVRRPAAGGHAHVQINWIDATGRLLHFWRRSLATVSVDGTFDFPQTAPPGATTAFVYLQGGGLRVDEVQLRRVRTGGP